MTRSKTCEIIVSINQVKPVFGRGALTCSANCLLYPHVLLCPCRYKDRYPENTAKVVIHNNSGLQAEVQFRFQDDDQATTFLLDPPAMSLKPDQKKVSLQWLFGACCTSAGLISVLFVLLLVLGQELTVWAYPTKVGQMKDSIVISVQDSSEPFSIPLSCWGVRPELKLESKHFHFDRIILHR